MSQFGGLNDMMEKIKKEHEQIIIKCCFCNIECEKENELWKCPTCTALWTKDNHLIPNDKENCSTIKGIKEIKNCNIYSSGSIKFEA